MKVLNSETTTTRSLVARCYGNRIQTVNPVNVYVSGLGVDDSVILEAELPDGSDWVPVADLNEITDDGLYVVSVSPAKLSLSLTNTSGSPINAWIVPDEQATRDQVHRG